MKNQKDATKRIAWIAILLCGLIAVAAYGMETASFTVGILLLAFACIVYALEKGRTYGEQLR